MPIKSVKISFTDRQTTVGTLSGFQDSAQKKQNKKNKHNAELQRADPGTKVKG